MATKINKQLLESYNMASILALEDIISRDVGALVNIHLADGSRSHRLAQDDIERAKSTILNLSAPLTAGYVMDVADKVEEAKLNRRIWQ
jgi:hypothetical protein